MTDPPPLQRPRVNRSSSDLIIFRALMDDSPNLSVDLWVRVAEYKGRRSWDTRSGVLVEPSKWFGMACHRGHTQHLGDCPSGQMDFPTSPFMASPRGRPRGQMQRGHCPPIYGHHNKPQGQIPTYTGNTSRPRGCSPRTMADLRIHTAVKAGGRPHGTRPLR